MFGGVDMNSERCVRAFSSVYAVESESCMLSTVVLVNVIWPTYSACDTLLLTCHCVAYAARDPEWSGVDGGAWPVQWPEFDQIIESISCIIQDD